MSDRADYVAALKVERENLSRRPVSPNQKRRVADVDAELGKFDEKPARAKRETAVLKDTKVTAAKPAAKTAATKPAAK
jgi:hypothetical protein